MLKIPRQYWEATSQKISWGHWFAFFNIVCAIAIGSRYAFIADWPGTLIGKIYFFLNILGHFSFIVFALYLLILFPLSFLIKNPYTFRAVGVILSTLGLTLLLLDTEVFNRFHLHLSLLVLNILINPDNGDLARDWERFFVPMPLIFLTVMLFSRWSWNKLRSLERQKWIRKIAYLLMFCFICSHLLYAWADAYFYRPITVQKANLPLSYPMTARTFLEKNQLLNRDTYLAQLNNSGRLDAPYLDYPKHLLEYNKQNADTNILLINISGLRHDAITLNDMPSLSALREQSLDYQNNYSGSNNQNGALVSLFYGLNANYFDSLLNQREQSVWVERMQQLQYQFGLFVTAPSQSPLYPRALFQRQNIQFNNRSNQQTTRQWLNWYQQQNDKPWFSYLQYDLLSVMANYPKTEAENQQQYYRLQLQEIDRQLAQILNPLSQNGLQNTVVIVTADQGYSYQAENNSDNNYFGHDRIQVPLLILWPGKAAQKIEDISSQMDLVPTLMQQLFQVKNPAQDYTQGKDLLDPQNHHDNWVFIANSRWNVVVTDSGEQYQIDSQGEYKEYNADYQKVDSEKPPLALFLQVFSRDRNFLAD
jgi:membrane-anchored protein YejM (alkaline phosphatase superfamily)